MITIAHPTVLALNGGSASIKFAVFHEAEPLRRGLFGRIERIGLSGATLTFSDPSGNPNGRLSLEATDSKSAARFLVGWLEEQDGFAAVGGVGHRVVHGMQHASPQPVTQELLDGLRRMSRETQRRPE